MEEKIIHALTECPDGLRLRVLAWCIGENPKYVLPKLHEMEDSGKIVTVIYHDPANMEYFTRYKLA